MTLGDLRSREESAGTSVTVTRSLWTDRVIAREPPEMGFGAEPAVPNVGSMMALDERGVGLRATWRLNYGFINLSIWRGDKCVETFHLTPANAAAFVTFLVQGLADVASVAPAAPVLRPVPDNATTRRPSLRREMKQRVAAGLRRAADRVEK